jgi:Flp pilus assembly protein TadD
MTKQLSALFMMLFACSSGCANLSPAPQGQVAAPSTPKPSAQKPVAETKRSKPSKSTQATPPATAQPTAGEAVIALLEQAKAQAGAGEGEQAAATLERAIRIEPRNPWLWHRLAVLRLQQGYWEEAIELAIKSNSLAGRNPRLQGGNWKVIGMALEGLGDAKGATEAQRKSAAYFQQTAEQPTAAP